MDQGQLEEKINELAKEFGVLAEVQYKKFAMASKQSPLSKDATEPYLDHLQELLDYLRVCVKYTRFDLEATRRENKYLKKLLEDIEC